MQLRINVSTVPLQLLEGKRVPRHHRIIHRVAGCMGPLEVLRPGPRFDICYREADSEFYVYVAHVQ